MFDVGDHVRIAFSLDGLHNGHFPQTNFGVVVESCNETQSCEVQFLLADESGFVNFIDIPWADLVNANPTNAG
jgi:hypothetical protein